MPRGKGPLRLAIEDFFDTVSLGKFAHSAVVYILEKLEDENLKIYGSLLRLYGLEGKVPTEYTLQNLTHVVKEAPSGFMVSLTAIVGLLLGGFMGISAPLRRKAEYAVDSIQHTYRPDPSTSMAMLRRNPNLEADLRKGLSEQGVNDSQFDYWLKITEQALQAFQLEALRLRGMISEAEYQSEMKIQGYTPERIRQVQSLAKQIPGPQDLISMAVREAWDDAVATRFQYDLGAPPEFGEWMEKQGFEEDWAKRYWRAHWQLPGLSSGYEMLHRLREGESDLPFTLDDLDKLLKAADVPPFFRDRLIEISYSPYTRVDVRRMFATGVLTRDEVYAAYHDLGYNDERAEKLTEFTTTIERAEEKGLTREAVTGGYRRGITSRPDAVAMLAEIGYKEPEAEYWLGLIDYDLEAAAVDEQLNVIKTQFVNWQIDETELTAKLAPLNLPSDRVQQITTLWNISRLNKAAAPSKSELEKFYALGFITLERIREYLKRDGYQPADIEMYVSRIDREVAEDAAKEQERAAKEADRLAASAEASQLMKDRAALDVRIAEARVAIADIKVALHQELPPSDVADLKTLSASLSAEIARLQLDKAKLKAA